MILLIAQNMNSLKKLATHVIPYIICCLHIVQVIFVIVVIFSSLPEYTTDLHKKSFIIRTLYKYV